jgi:hypothetical protein
MGSEVAPPPSTETEVFPIIPVCHYLNRQFNMPITGICRTGAASTPLRLNENLHWHIELPDS